MAAAERGYDDIALLLIREGANVHYIGFLGDSALHFAARQGADDVVRRLLDCGVDVNGTTSEGLPPLEVAAQRGRWYVVDLLLARGAKPSLCSGTVLTIMAAALRSDVMRRFLEGGLDFDDGQKQAAINAAPEQYRGELKQLLEYYELPIKWHPDE